MTEEGLCLIGLYQDEFYQNHIFYKNVCTNLDILEKFDKKTYSTG